MRCWLEPVIPAGAAPPSDGLTRQPGVRLTIKLESMYTAMCRLNGLIGGNLYINCILLDIKRYYAMLSIKIGHCPLAISDIWLFGPSNDSDTLLTLTRQA
jgi:hypothetical protein